MPTALKRNKTHSLKKQHVIELDYMYYREFFTVRARSLGMYYLKRLRLFKNKVLIERLTELCNSKE